MFNKMPDLFDRNFAVGYFLPIVIFIASSLFLVNEFNVLSFSFGENILGKIVTLIGTTVIGLLSWLGGILLLAINTDILRLMEGYGTLNPANLFSFIEKQRYVKLIERKEELNAEYNMFSKDGQKFPESLNQERNLLLQKLVERFPDQDRFILPTSFGNTIRAFEVYSRVMYGIDAIPAWPRLLAVIPEDYRKFIDDAKSQVDFWANIWLVSITLILEYCVFLLHLSQKWGQTWWIPLTIILLIFFAFYRARIAAANWGTLVKSSFDLFLDDLREKLGFSKPSNIDEERNIWNRFSQTVLYSDPSDLSIRYKKVSEKSVETIARQDFEIFFRISDQNLTVQSFQVTFQTPSNSHILENEEDS